MKKFILILCIISLTINGIWAKSKKKKKEAEPAIDYSFLSGYTEPVMPVGDIFEIDNFEEAFFWEKDFTYTSYAINATPYTKWASLGTRSVKFDYALTKNQKNLAYFTCEDLVENDWTGAKYVAFNINNPGKECLYLSFGTKSQEKTKTEDELIFENTLTNLSEEHVCPPGEHLVVIDISSFQDLYNTSGVVLTVNTETTLNSRTASFYMDNLRIVFDPDALFQTAD